MREQPLGIHRTASTQGRLDKEMNSKLNGKESLNLEDCERLSANVLLSLSQVLSSSSCSESFPLYYFPHGIFQHHGAFAFPLFGPWFVEKLKQFQVGKFIR